MAPASPFLVPAFADPSVNTFTSAAVGGTSSAARHLSSGAAVLRTVRTSPVWMWTLGGAGFHGAVLAAMSNGSLGRLLRPAAALSRVHYRFPSYIVSMAAATQKQDCLWLRL